MDYQLPILLKKIKLLKIKMEKDKLIFMMKMESLLKVLKYLLRYILNLEPLSKKLVLNIKFLKIRKEIQFISIINNYQ